MNREGEWLCTVRFERGAGCSYSVQAAQGFECVDSSPCVDELSFLVVLLFEYTAKNPRVCFRPLVENGPLQARERPVYRM